MKIAVVGATGLVGRKMIRVLKERNLPITKLIAVASERSVGKVVRFEESEIEIVSAESAIEQKPDIALFSAGGEASKFWAPKFAAAGITVIDNSSAWRMDPEVPLVVPEINGSVLRKEHKIIANPNCSTIQMVMALAPLHRRFGIKRIVVSTYQSVSGSGIKGINQLMDERKNKKGEKVYPYRIDMNTLAHAGDFDGDGYTSEEIKLVNETQKILNDKIAVSATVVRVPVVAGHSESVNVELKHPFKLEEVKYLISEMPGVTLQDNPERNLYPMPIFAEDKDDVFVGRIRRDHTLENGLNLWVVADNLRKGAATNAVQIAEYLKAHNLTH